MYPSTERVFVYMIVYLLVLGVTFAAPVTQHVAGGLEHIVIIDKNHPTPPRVSEVLERLALSENHSDVRHIYNNTAFQGFAAAMKPHCLDLLANMSDISLVEQAVHITGASHSARSTVTYNTRSDAPWGLQRISTSSAVNGNPSTLDYTYTFADPALGSGADIYIIDTGVYTANNIFGGRANMIWSYDNSTTDEDGHGTHVAGTAAGAVLGVASGATIHGLKALGADGTGWSSNIIAAIDFAIQTHESRQAQYPSNFTGSVISLSLASSGPISAINAALLSASTLGIHACVAAGNTGTDACDSSPASAGGDHGPVLTVGAIDIAAGRASFSNTGPCVDVYAPGVDVLSAWIGASDMVNLLSGTSMATPHVTGLVACAMAANRTLAADPAAMKAWIKATALRLPDGTLMVNNGVRGGNEVENAAGFLGFEKIGAGPKFATVKNGGGKSGPR